MFGFVLTSAVTVLHVYVFWRIGSIPYIKQYFPFKYRFATGLIAWAVFFIGREFGHGETGVFAVLLERVGMDWMAILFLLAIALFEIDLITGFGFILTRWAPMLRGWALIGGMGLSLIAVVQGTRPPVIREYAVHLSHLSEALDGMKILALSDLHLGTLINEKWLDARIDQVLAEKPDIVVLLGDTFEGHGESVDKLIPVFQRLHAPLGVWAVSGNHDSYGRRSAGTSPLQVAGIQTLRNSWVELHPGFTLAGVDDSSPGRGDEQLNRALANRPPGTTVLLSHRPVNVERAANLHTDVMMSGHTHGGQVWPIDYIVQSEYPFLEGRFSIGDMALIVSRGTGTWGPRVRLWHPGEILKITLHR
jgi:uncharacterized protein